MNYYSGEEPKLGDIVIGINRRSIHNAIVKEIGNSTRILIETIIPKGSSTTKNIRFVEAKYFKLIYRNENNNGI